jgi:hypothetical protein
VDFKSLGLQDCSRLGRRWEAGKVERQRLTCQRQERVVERQPEEEV